MNYKVGDKVLCPPSGSACGPREGIIIRIDKSVLVLVKYVNPTETHDAWVHPIKKLTK